jgi:hypothetical protein
VNQVRWTRRDFFISPWFQERCAIDTTIDRTTTILTKKCETFVHSIYENTSVFNFEDFVKNLTPREPPRAIATGPEDEIDEAFKV